MLIIRKEQMETFEEYMIDAFNKKMVLHLSNVCPEETASVSDEELSLVVKNGLEKAESYDITEENDIQRFLEHMLVHGPGFDDGSDPVAQEILHDTDLDGEDKMDKIDFYYGKGEED